MPSEDEVVAVAFLTQRDLSVLGQGFRRAYPITNHHEFDDLLRQIDVALGETDLVPENKGRPGAKPSRD